MVAANESAGQSLAGFDWPHGTFARIARRFPSPTRKGKRLTSEAVRRVALGMSKSAKVLRALEREKARIEAERAAREQQVTAA